MKRETHDVFALAGASDVDGVAALLGRCASCPKLVAHDSSFWGDYWLGDDRLLQVRVFQNSDPIDGEPIDSAAPVDLAVFTAVGDAERVARFLAEVRAVSRGALTCYSKKRAPADRDE